MPRKSRLDRRFMPGPEALPVPEAGLIVAFRDRWGEVVRQYDMRGIGLPAALIGLFTEAFRERGASISPAYRRNFWDSQRQFARYLASLARPVTVADLNIHLVNGYLTWLKIQCSDGGKPWALPTQNKHYAPIKLLLNWLASSGHIPPVEFPENPFPGRHVPHPQTRLPQEQLKAILAACYREIDTAWARFELGQQLLAEPASASDLGGLLQELRRKGGGIMPRCHTVGELCRRTDPYGGMLATAEYLHLTVATLAPFYLAIAIQTAANPDPLREIRRDCLVPHPLDPNQIMIEWAKPRAGGAVRHVQRRSFDRRRPYAAPNLIDKLLTMTAPLVPHARRADQERLFLVRGKTARGVATITAQTLTCGIYAFIARANAASATANRESPQARLPHFTPKQFRGSVATRHYTVSGGDIRIAQTVLNHARADTTDLYVRGPEAERIQNETMARLQTMMVAWVSAPTGQGKSVAASATLLAAHAHGHLCINPLAGPKAAELRGQICPAFLGCLACPGLVIPADAQHLARILQLKAALEAARERIDAHRWTLFYWPSLRILTEDILPEFPETLHGEALELMGSLSPLAELE